MCALPRSVLIHSSYFSRCFISATASGSSCLISSSLYSRSGFRSPTLKILKPAEFTSTSLMPPTLTESSPARICGCSVPSDTYPRSPSGPAGPWYLL